MSKLKSIQRSGTLAWSTSADRPALLAAGTVAGAIDDSFECTAHLEIFNLDLASADQSMPLLGSVTTSERFQRLAWGASSGAAGFEHGVLAGGMVDGTIKVFNPAKIISGQHDDAVVATVDKHHGPVRGLEFNWNQPNLLASGASDADMYITDLAAPASPTFYTPGQRQQGSTGADISCVAWNRKVHHILASTTNSGQTVVWDLKLKRPVISFNDPNNKTQRNSVVCWNPEVATQLIVASEDDSYPLLQMWDLRNAFAPVKDLRGHTKGILAASWCPFDNGLLLSAGKDNRTLCWDPLMGTVLCELPASANWNFDVQWSPRIPAVLSTGSFDGQVAVYSLTDTSPPVDSWQVHGGAEPAQSARRAPKWLRRPCGASFGFGGELVTFGAPQLLPGGALAAPRVHHFRVVTEPQVVARAAELHAALEGGGVHELCNAKAAAAEQAGEQTERAVWGLLAVLSSDDARQQLIHYLRIDAEGVAPFPELEQSAAAAAAGAAAAAVAAGAQGTAAEQFAAAAMAAEAEMDIAAAQSLAELTLADGGAVLQLRQEIGEASVGAASPLVTSAAAASVAANAVANGGGAARGATLPPAPASVSPEVEATLRRLLVRGLFEEAVGVCMEHGHMAEALLLAASGGPDLWASARDRLLASHPAPFMRVLGAVVHQSFGQLVDESRLGHWRETLAILNTYAGDDELAPLCNQLALRLQSEGQDKATAMLCFICAGNVRDTTNLWLESLRAAVGAPLAAAAAQPAASERRLPSSVCGARADPLLGFVERLLVLRRVTGDGGQDAPAEVGERFAEYAQLLAAQGELATAAALLSHAAPAGGGSAGGASEALLWRILQTGKVPPTPSGLAFGSPPPFAMLDVGAAPEPPPRQTRRSLTSHVGGAMGGGAMGGGGGGGLGEQSELFAQCHSALGGTDALAHPAHSAAAGGGGGGYGAQAGAGYGNGQPQGAQPRALPAAAQYAQQAQLQQPGYAQPAVGAAGGYAGGAPMGQPTYTPQPAYAPQPAYGSQPLAPAYPQPPQPQAQPAYGYGAAPPAQPQPQPQPQPAAPFVPQAAYGVAAPSPTGYAPPPQPQPQQQQQAQAAAGAGAPAMPHVFTPVAQPAQQYSQQPPAAPAPAPRPAPPPAPPPPQNMADADTSALSGNALHVAQTLRTYMDGLMAAASSPMEAKKLEDVSKRLGMLLYRMNCQLLSPTVVDKLAALTQAVSVGDYRTALAIHVDLTTCDWADNGVWLIGLKRMVEALAKRTGK